MTPVQTLSEIRALLEARGLAPRKQLGQNFLVDHNLLARLVDDAGVQAGDAVLEVGPGTGTLTEELLDRGARVVACELDRGLAALLRERLASRDFLLIEGDCLETGKRLRADALAALRARGSTFRLVANLPYGAATPLMIDLLTRAPDCLSLHVTIQREVADRLTARPGTREYGPLSLIARALADVQLVAKLPPECFWPRPDVTSAMVSLRRLPAPHTDDPRGFADFAKAIFTGRRKQLGGVVRDLTGLAAGSIPWPGGISPSQRAEELDLAEMLSLFGALRPNLRPPNVEDLDSGAAPR